MKRIPVKERLAVAVILCMAVSNPLTGQYVLQGLDWVFTQIFTYGAMVTLLGAVYLLGLGAWYYYRAEKPKTAGKHKTQAYIET